MAARVEWSGLQEFKKQLRNLPTELRAEADEIVTATAHEAAAEIVAAYPTGPTGNLKKGVKVRQANGGAVVISAAPHAHLYEFGTQARQDDLGRNRGSMPPKPTVIPIAQRKRRGMYERLKAMVEKHGLEVKGEIG